MVARAKKFDEDDERRRYVVRLIIKHPSVDPSTITKKLGLTPHIANLAGTHRESPNGTPLPGVYERSVWGYSVRVEGKRFFFEDVVKLIDAIEPHAEFLLEIVGTNGTVDLIFDLPGDVNIGDVMPWRELGRLSALKISLGIEVFPSFN